jgi:hypothetical protein
VPTPGQQSLSNFYQSVKFSHPRTAALMHADVLQVGIFALAQDKSPAQESADNLREMSADLPEVIKRVLENALIELGFPDSR